MEKFRIKNFKGMTMKSSKKDPKKNFEKNHKKNPEKNPKRTQKKNPKKNHENNLENNPIKSLKNPINNFKSHLIFQVMILAKFLDHCDMEFYS